MTLDMLDMLDKLTRCTVVTIRYGSFAIPKQPKQAFPNELRNRAMSGRRRRASISCAWLCMSVGFKNEFAPQVRGSLSGQRIVK